MIIGSSYAVVVNGIPRNVILPTRGLRHPCVFLICAEGLSNMLQQAEMKGVIQGVAASRGGIRINHLLFANNCVIFCRVKLKEWFNLLHLLHAYEVASGQP